MSIATLDRRRATAAPQAVQPRKAHFAQLDGLRFLAALFVALAHYAAWTLHPGKMTDLLISVSGLGMTVFFVLSGFVIHYNYGALLREPGGLKKFAVARFSRLYPLYIALFLIEFIVISTSPAGSDESGSCGQAGHPAGLVFGLPFYLTLTQDWFFGVICKNNLIYQYGPMAEVSWSISAELFFYVLYCFYGRWAARKRPLTLFLVAGCVYLLFFGFVRECYVHRELVDQTALAAFGPIATEQHGYQDSLLRWLFYFSPLSQIVHFLAGVAIGQRFLAADPAHSEETGQRGNWLVTASVLLVLSIHFYMYGVLAYHSPFIGRTASAFCGPLVVASIYFLIRFPENTLSRLLSRPFMVRSGEASYSLYLLHAFLSWYLLQLKDIGLHVWALYAVSLLSLLFVSRVSYVGFERPARNMLRGLLGDDPRVGRGLGSVPSLAA